MGKLGAFETGIILTVAAAGVGVAASAVMAEVLEVKKDDVVSDELELVMPKNREEAVRSWVWGYLQSKDVLPKVFRFAGQMFVAPIVVVGLDAAYALYNKRCESKGVSM